jgi:syntaxin-binding protein 5
MKRTLEQGRPNDLQRGAPGQAGPSSGAGGDQEGYWAYMQRQITERTEKMGTLSDAVTRLEETSAQWADDASKYVQKQKRNMMVNAVKGKVGL